MEKQTANQMVKFIKNTNLKICVDELIDFHQTGILKTGLVREFAQGLVENLGQSVVPYKLKIAEDLILMEAATRFSDSYSL
jgi:hypothetical protein